MVRRHDEPRTDEPPWTLDRVEMAALADGGVRAESLDDVLPEGRVNRLWRLVLSRR